MHSFLPMGGKVLAAARNRYSLEWGSRTGVRLKKRAILRAWEVSVKHSNFRLTSPPNKRSPTLSLVGQMKGSSKLCSSCWWPNPYTIYILYFFYTLQIIHIKEETPSSPWNLSPGGAFDLARITSDPPMVASAARQRCRGGISKGSTVATSCIDEEVQVDSCWFTKKRYNIDMIYVVSFGDLRPGW